MLRDFEKWQGCQNDFIVIWAKNSEEQLMLETLQRLAPTLCSREGLGIGADGILLLLHANDWLRDPESHPWELHVINQDGSLAKNCGNGLRCAALSIYRRALTLKDNVRPAEVLLTIAGHTYRCTMTDTRRDNPAVEIAIGVPTLNKENTWHDKVFQHLSSSTHTKQIREFATCTLGNDHLACFAEQGSWDELKALVHDLGEMGKELNVHWVMEGTAPQQAAKVLGKRKLGEAFSVLNWERGVGPTKACGSGAAAVAAALFADDFRARDEWIAIAMPGGTLYALQSEAGGELRLLGEAALVFKGNIEI